MSDLNIEILGVNQVGAQGSNPLIALRGDLPWLQPAGGDHPDSEWDVAWDVRYRDVWIVGPDGEKKGVFNLTDHNLQTPANYAALKQLLLEAAVAVDTDGDGLRDDWERRFFGGLGVSAARDSDTDGDGVTDWDEFVFASHPGDPRSRPQKALVRGLVQVGGVPVPSLVVRCCAGHEVRFQGELSEDLRAWRSTATDVFELSSRQVLYDGNGAALAVFVLGQDARPLPRWFMRVVADGGGG